MKRIHVEFLPVVVLALIFNADVSRAQLSPSQVSSVQADDYAVTSQGADWRVWQKTVVENGVSRVHQYTELATGLNYWQNGQWVESQEKIVVQPDGTAAATQGQHQAYFPGDIYNGQIELVTPDGLSLKSRPVGLSYDDGTNTVLFAVLTNSAGQVLGDNQVIYTNAFAGLTADLLYTYTKSGFEQDVILRQQPPTPESLGLNPGTARLQVLTEFFSAPSPSIDAWNLPPQAGIALNDECLGFGQLEMVPGRAFLLGQNAQDTGAMVAKHWLTVEGRQFLIEEVPVNAISEGLAGLPLTAINATLNKNVRMALRNQKLPPPRLIKSASKSTLMAKARLSRTKGLVLDYQTINSSHTNYTFQGDTTYYISGSVSLLATSTFEGGAVLKYATNGAIILVPSSVGFPFISWKGSAYRPVVFTAKDDNSVGESISGSTGNPTNHYGSPMLELVSFSSTPTVRNIRLSYAKTALEFAGASLNLYDAQFVQCQFGLNAAGATLNLRNALFANNNTNCLANGGVTLNVQNGTFSGSGCVGAASSSPTDCYLALTNCIFANVTNITNGIFTLNGGYNGFYNTSNFGDATVSSYGYPFQSVGAGSYYLTSGGYFFNAGTPTIDSALLADLATKTTSPPLIYTNAIFTNSLILYVQAIRDTTGTPDLGYHYDPLDYVFSACYLYTNLTVTAGTAIGFFDKAPTGGYRAGIALPDGANFTINGNAEQPCWLADFKTVQEGGNGNWTNASGDGHIFIQGSGLTPLPLLTATSTKWSSLAAGDAHVNNPAGHGAFPNHGVGAFSDCEFYGGGIATYLAPYYFTNCLFWRVQTTYWDQNDAANCALLNCTFYNGFLSLYRTNWQDASFWNIQNTAFDGTAIDMQDNHNGDTNYATIRNNAYNVANSNWLVQSFGYPVTNKLEVVSAQDILTNGFNWQSGSLGNFYLPTNSPLINAGSDTVADVGLTDYTTQASQIPDTGTVDIGYHYITAIRPGFTNNSLGPNDDDHYIEDDDSGELITNLLATIGFSVNFYGTTYTNLYVNNNGNVTFKNYLPDFSPNVTLIEEIQLDGFGISGIIAPFWADVDTRATNSNVVTYGTGTVDGHAAFGVNWIDVGYYKTNADKLNSFQLVLISRSDRTNGDFDLEFDYSQIQWEEGDATSMGGHGFSSSNTYPPRVGFASVPSSLFELNGTGIKGAFLDVNFVTGLIHNSFNNTVPGRYVFQFTNGLPSHP